MLTSPLGACCCGRWCLRTHCRCAALCEPCLCVCCGVRCAVGLQRAKSAAQAASVHLWRAVCQHGRWRLRTHRVCAAVVCCVFVALRGDCLQQPGSAGRAASLPAWGVAFTHTHSVRRCVNPASVSLCCAAPCMHVCTCSLACRDSIQSRMSCCGNVRSRTHTHTCWMLSIRQSTMCGCGSGPGLEQGGLLCLGHWVGAGVPGARGGGRAYGLLSQASMRRGCHASTE